VESVYKAFEAHDVEKAKLELGKLVALVNDKVNADSFMHGLLSDLEEDLDRFDDLPKCTGAMGRTMGDLRQIASAMEISPRKWSIDRHDCDVAMEAFRDAVDEIQTALTECHVFVVTIQDLAKALAARQWEHISGELRLFKENVLQPFWTLAQAIAKRDWTAAGQVVAQFALKAWTFATRDGNSNPKLRAIETAEE